MGNWTPAGAENGRFLLVDKDKSRLCLYTLLMRQLVSFPRENCTPADREKRAAFSLSAASCAFFPFLGSCVLGRDFFLLGKPSGGSLLMILEGFVHFPAAEGGDGAVVAVAGILRDHAVGAVFLDRLADEIVDVFLEEFSIHAAIVVLAVSERVVQKACNEVFIELLPAFFVGRRVDGKAFLEGVLAEIVCVVLLHFQLDAFLRVVRRLERSRMDGERAVGLCADVAVFTEDLAIDGIRFAVDGLFYLSEHFLDLGEFERRDDEIVFVGRKLHARETRLVHVPKPRRTVLESVLGILDVADSKFSCRLP